MAIENSMKKKDYANAIRLAAECKEKDTHLPGLVKQWKQYRDKALDELDKGDKSEEGIHKPTAEEIAQRIRELNERKEDYEEKLQSIENTEVTEISTVDPDARQMSVNNNGTNICYNVQTAVDGKHSLIVDYDVINNPSDHGQLSQMAKRAQKVLNKKELHVLADKGYYSASELMACEEAG